MEHLILELGLAIVLMAISAVVAKRLRISVVPFLILIGLAVGSHMPDTGLINFRFERSTPLIQFLGRIGVLFLLFYLGVEFSLKRLVSAGRSIAVAGTIYIGINLTLGLLFGWVLGWPIREILVVAGITTISSTAIVAKMISDLRRSARPETGLIVGIIMFEDVFLAGYISLLSGVVLGEEASIGSTALSVGVIAAVLVTLFAVGRYLSRYLDELFDVDSQEIFILMVFGSLFLVAGLSEEIGVAEAIGALLLGLVLAETGHVDRIREVVLPFRDLFGAIFFFSFGLSIDPLTLREAFGLAVAAALVTIAGNFAAGIIAGRIAGLSGQAQVNIGLTIVSRGEFSIVVASVARAGNLMPIIQPFTAAYVLLLSIFGPVLTRESTKVYAGLVRLGQMVTPAKPAPLPPTPDEVPEPEETKRRS